MSTAHILLVEDEQFLAKVIKDSLEQRGYTVMLAGDGKKAYSLFLNNVFSICIVDVMLPHTDGFTLAKQIRTHNTNTPILFLTAKAATEDVIEGYHSGGNDYLKKPFSLEELFLRINELLKRSSSDKLQDEELLIGKFKFIPYKQTLRYQQDPEIKLSHRESTLLTLLYKNKNSILDRKNALQTLWGDDNFYNTRTMDVFITKIRKHLKQDPTIEILNIRGMGYKLIC